MKIGLLTSGGDCAGLNAVMRGFAKSAYKQIPSAEIVGILGGYAGLIDGEFRQMKKEEFNGILTVGGTVLGSSRLPYKLVSSVVDKGSKVEAMKATYKKLGLDALVVLGGAGSHKTAALLSTEGLNVVGLPKTIDNDIWDTDMTFGFHSAMAIATECIDRIRTTAQSHKRTFVVEIMGNKVGWLTLYAGLAGGANVILLPEIPYDITKVIKAVDRFTKAQSDKSCIIAVAEGAMDKKEVSMGKKERSKKRTERGETTASNRIAAAVGEALNIETRVVVPGHTQRGGIPSAYDRVLCTQIGAYGADLVAQKKFGVTVALQGNKITYNQLADIAGKPKLVPIDHPLIQTAISIDVSFGE